MTINPNVKMRLLKQSAIESAEWRGHILGKWNIYNNKIQHAKCINCDMQVAVNVAPLPNQINIGGEAVALDCGDNNG